MVMLKSIYLVVGINIDVKTFPLYLLPWLDDFAEKIVSNVNTR